MFNNLYLCLGCVIRDSPSQTFSLTFFVWDCAENRHGKFPRVFLVLNEIIEEID